MFTRKRETSAALVGILPGSPAPRAGRGTQSWKPIDAADLPPGTSAYEPVVQACRREAATPAEGAQIFAERMRACHGPGRQGGVTISAPLPPLVGGGPITDISAATKTDRQFLAVLHDGLRLHPACDALAATETLTNDEVYALTAYILASNKLIGENDAMDAKTLPKVQMPNRDGFIIRFPDRM